MSFGNLGTDVFHVESILFRGIFHQALRIILFAMGRPRECKNSWVVTFLRTSLRFSQNVETTQALQSGIPLMP